MIKHSMVTVAKSDQLLKCIIQQANETNMITALLHKLFTRPFSWISNCIKSLYYQIVTLLFVLTALINYQDLWMLLHLLQRYSTLMRVFFPTIIRVSCVITANLRGVFSMLKRKARSAAFPFPTQLSIVVLSKHL